MSSPRLHLARDGRSLGQRDLDGITPALMTGELRLTDLSWCEGEPAWIPLGRRPAFAAVLDYRVLPEPALERLPEVGLVRALVLTLRDTLLSPRRTFGRLPSAGRLATPFLLHLLLACTANALGLLWAEWLIRPIWERSLGGMGPYLPWGEVYRFFGWYALATPVLVLAGALVVPTILHLALRLVGGGKGGWGVTFRVLNYIGAATNVILAVPMLGMVAALWGAFCLVAGLGAAHRDDPWRPLLALALTCAAGCCLLVGAVFLALFPFFAQLG